MRQRSVPAGSGQTIPLHGETVSGRVVWTLQVAEGAIAEHVPVRLHMSRAAGHANSKSIPSSA